MKKILLFAVILVAMAACCKNDLDKFPIAPEGKKATVTVAAEGAQSRVSYDDDWAVNWNLGDELMAVNANGVYSKFTMVEDTDIDNPTFEGTTVGDNYFLIYPYSAALEDIEYRKSVFDVDLTSQKAGATKSYMVSEEAISADVTASNVKMKHLGATMTLDMKFTGYDGYTIESLEVSGFNSNASLDLRKGTFDYTYDLANFGSRKITITDGESRINAADGGIVKVRFNIFSTIIKTGGFVKIIVHLRSDDGTTLDLIKQITVNKWLEFARATYNTFKCGFSKEDSFNGYWTDYTHDEFAGGTGVESDPFKISTAAQLARLAKGVNNGSIKAYQDTYFELTNDIDLSDHRWVPIGTSSLAFHGNFNGNGYKVCGINIDIIGERIGLFGYIRDATIENLTVSGYVKGSKYVGGLAGYVFSCTLTNCNNSCSVEGSGEKVGGIAGYVTESSTITNCSNSGSIEGSGMSVGGVVGELASNSKLNNCHNSGAIKGSYKSVGGVAGELYGDCILTNCYNTGSVEGSSENVGGVVGYLLTNNSADNCYNSGQVVGSDYVGGVFGHISSSQVSNCYNTYSVKGRDYVGGVVGYNSSTSLDNCYNTYSVEGRGYVGGVLGSIYESIVTKCYNSGSIESSGNYVGGVVGELKSNSKLTSCHNSGAVGGVNNIGGVVGHLRKSTLISCYNSGIVGGGDNIGGFAGYVYDYSIVTNCYNSGLVDGNNNVGGVAGYVSSHSLIANCYNTASVDGSKNVGGVAGYIVIKSKIANCYNSNSVTSTNYYIGGVAGVVNSDCTFTDCYWNKDLYNDKGIGSGNGYGTSTGISTYEMKASAFVNDLNINAHNYNNTLPKPTINAYVWKYVAGEYPTLDFDNIENNNNNYWTYYADDEFAGGTGTESDPFQISTAAQLAKIAIDVKRSITNYSGKYFELTGDIDLSGYEWEAIGTLHNNFEGNFNGNNYNVFGLYIDEPNYQGLFGAISGAVIESLTVSGSVKGDYYLGGIVGRASKSRVNNCSNNCSVEGIDYVGGIVGQALDSELIICNNNGLVKGSGEYVGDIAGQNN